MKQISPVWDIYSSNFRGVRGDMSPVYILSYCHQIFSKFSNLVYQKHHSFLGFLAGMNQLIIETWRFYCLKKLHPFFLDEAKIIESTNWDGFQSWISQDSSWVFPHLIHQELEEKKQVGPTLLFFMVRNARNMS